jgi:hypothetical protein
MKIVFKTLTGDNVRMEVEPGYTVGVLKAMIEQSEGIPVDQQRIIYADKQLEDSRTLGDYGVREGSMSMQSATLSDYLLAKGSCPYSS